MTDSLTQLLMIGLGALALSLLFKYTVLVHVRWAEEQGARMGLSAESRGPTTVLSGLYEGAALRLVLRGRRIAEGEARVPPGPVRRPTRDAFIAAKERFGPTHFKADGVWAEPKDARAGDPPEGYADALVTVAKFVAGRSPEELMAIERGEVPEAVRWTVPTGRCSEQE